MKLLETPEVHLVLIVYLLQLVVVEFNLTKEDHQIMDLVDQGVPLAIGSDSHAVIDPWAELRTLEYQARASTGRRCVVTDQDGQVAPALIKVGHDHGYRCLGLSPEGDRVWMDGDARLFDGSEDLLATAVTAGHPGVVREVEGGGERVVAQGRHLA